jgi:hypothetical protein
MPTVLRLGPYRFFFYSGDGSEPPHVHVERDQYVAKVWLDPVRLARSGGYRAGELRSILDLVRLNQGPLLEAWNGYFDK